MSKPLAGKRYFHALGERTQTLYEGRLVMLSGAMRAAGMANVPLWAKNAFVDGWFGVQLRRRPAWTEAEEKFSCSRAEAEHT